MVDIKGAPLVVSVGLANRHDSILFEEIFHQLNACDREKVKVIAADSAYDSIKLRNICKKENFVLLASTNRGRNKDKPIYKPVCRWVVERTFGWLAWFRGLKNCWAKTFTSYLSFLFLVTSSYLFKMGGI